MIRCTVVVAAPTPAIPRMDKPGALLTTAQPVAAAKVSAIATTGRRMVAKPTCSRARPTAANAATRVLRANNVRPADASVCRERTVASDSAPLCGLHNPRGSHTRGSYGGSRMTDPAPPGPLTEPELGGSSPAPQDASAAEVIERFRDSATPREVAQVLSNEREWRALSLFACFAVALIAWVAMPVGIGILLGTLTAFTLQPTYERLIIRTGRPKLSALLCVGLATAGIAGTVTGVAFLLVSRGVVMAEKLLVALSPGGAGREFMDRLSRLATLVHIDLAMVVAKLRDAAAELASRAALLAGVVAQAAFSGFVTVFFLVMTIHFVLRNWDDITRRAEDMLPLNARHTHALFAEFQKVGRTVLLGTLVTGVAQGALAAIGYLVFGVPEAVFFGALTAAASLLPVVGTMLVWVPAGLFLVVTGHAAGGVLELVYGGVVVVGVSDYIIRPKLVDGHGEMPALITFISLLGGAEVFGLIGLILGPLLVSIAVALLRIYARESARRRN
jgi:predicted PurR-regulated permease PerM